MSNCPYWSSKSKHKQGRIEWISKSSCHYCISQQIDTMYLKSECYNKYHLPLLCCILSKAFLLSTAFFFRLTSSTVPDAHATKIQLHCNCTKCWYVLCFPDLVTWLTCIFLPEDEWFLPDDVLCDTTVTSCGTVPISVWKEIINRYKFIVHYSNIHTAITKYLCSVRENSLLRKEKTCTIVL